MLAGHIKRICCYFGLNRKEILPVEDQKICMLYYMLLRPCFFQPKWHSFSFFDQSLVQIERRDEDLIEVVALIQQRKVRLKLVRPGKCSILMRKIIRKEVLPFLVKTINIHYQLFFFFLLRLSLIFCLEILLPDRWQFLHFCLYDAGQLAAIGVETD